MTIKLQNQNFSLDKKIDQSLKSLLSEGLDKMKDKETGLTPKQTAFIAYYCGESKYNAVDAARKAGYKGNENTLNQMAMQNLHKPTIKAQIHKHFEKIAKKTDVTVDFVVSKLLSGLQLAEERKNTNAMARFLELLGRYLAMFTDNVTSTDLTRQKELEAAEAEEAERIANIRLNDFAKAKAG